MRVKTVDFSKYDCVMHWLL